ncbi:hypothetical protein CATMQ487_26660 [Sphaerotilus microaerophilus]|uniref:Uncharacterized protein n=1 Tax=Sphaerotilus microaerophilus TaxID=2914710 RepID=A0ABM7YML1_9BURK|nr:hypothetical protein CATMQ487_26660 [Sphaerotilus sp. FB-5]
MVMADSERVSWTGTLDAAWQVAKPDSSLGEQACDSHAGHAIGGYELGTKGGRPPQPATLSG